MIFNVGAAVKPQLVSISASSSVTAYNYNSTIDTTKITCIATYTNGEQKAVSAFTISPTKATSSTITVTYTEDNITKTTTFSISVDRVLSSIAVSSSQTTYNYNATIDKTKITCTASFTDGSTATIASSNFTISPTKATSTPVTVSYTENGVTKTATFAITIKRVLSSITATSSVTTYNYNATIDTSKITCTASFTDGTTANVTGFTISPTKATSSPVTVTYTENGTTKTSTFAITVKRVLSSITASSSVTTFNYNDTIDKTKITCTATFTDGTTATISSSNFSISPTKATSTPVTVSYTENGTTKTATYAITIYKVLSSITVSSSVTSYNYGATIDKTKITCTAKFTDNTTANVPSSDFTISPTTASHSNTTVTVSYTYRSVTKTGTFTYTCNKVLQSITATPGATAYAYNSNVTATTTAKYSDNSTATVTGTLSPTKATAKTITVTYSGKSTTMSINVYPLASQYTGGNATVTNEGSGKWTMYCNTSGTLDLKLAYSVDVWVVGGGGGGAPSGKVSNCKGAGGGGGGGYTNLGSNKSIAANTTYAVTVGAGGTRGAVTVSYWANIIEGGTGGQSSALSVSANGGQGGATTNGASGIRPKGGNGGSGGGGIGPGTEWTYGGNGGSNGANGIGSFPGIGAGVSTRDFRATSGTLRCGAGGGGNYKYWNWNGGNDVCRGQGGAGGGGNGTYGQWTDGTEYNLRSGDNGVANYGGGAGGGGYNEGTGASQHCNGGYGGSGIVIIRTHR